MIDHLRSLGVNPTWFGLGFIQLKLTDTKRMHFWHPAFKATDAYDNEWHDHRYAFKSEVLVGEITNELAYITSDGGPYEVHEVCCEGMGAEFAHMAQMYPIGTFSTSAGSSYYIEADTFHRVTTTPYCATIQNRIALPPYKTKARVMCEKYETANPFGIVKPVEELWAAIEEVLKMGNPGYHIDQIVKGELGEASKIREEIDELVDAVKQNCRIMQLVELSDALGAMEAFLARHHPGYTLDDLHAMKTITARAFQNGRR